MNNGAVADPGVNPWNERQADLDAQDRHDDDGKEAGRDSNQGQSVL